MVTMIRLFYMSDSLEVAEKASQQLHAAGVTDWNFHVVSTDEAGLYQRHLHGAAPWHKRDILRSGERGAILGLCFGVLVALLALISSSSPLLQHPLTAVSICVVCTLFGTWVGGLLGLNTEHYQLARFHDAIAAGKYLIMVDTRKSRLDLVKQQMASIPQVSLVGADQTVVMPFARA
jgi:hypothetical protein